MKRGMKTAVRREREKGARKTGKMERGEEQEEESRKKKRRKKRAGRKEQEKGAGDKK